MAMDSMQVAPSCLLLFQDDGLVCSYADGSALEMSPCGSTFIHTQAAPSDLHPLLGTRRETVQQRTIYVTSKYKAKVQYAIDSRNRFASRPYITSNLLHDTDYVLDTYADIKEVNWSPELDEAYVDVLDNGGLRLRSLDECASMILAPNNHDFSIEYLCKISDRIIDSTSSMKNSKGHCYKNHAGKTVRLTGCDPYGTGEADSCRSLETATPAIRQQSMQFAYIWMIQHLSVEHCPLEWQHPLQLVMKFKHMRRISVRKTMSATNGTPLSEEGSIAQNVPDSKANALKENCLTLSCSASVVSGDDDDNDTHGRCKMRDHFIEKSHFANRHLSRTIPAAFVNGTFENSVKMQLPGHLPLKCPNPHLHHWRKISSKHQLSENVDFDALVKTTNCTLKMMMANGVIYRFFLDPVASVEIYPGDGSVITLQDSRGQYFTHTKVNRDGSTTDKMFIANNQTMLCNSPQSALVRMVNKASRLLNVMLYNTKSSPEVCWKVLEPVQIQKKLLSVIEETTVPGLGHFTAFSDGQLRIVFADRTILDMVADDHKVTRELTDAQLQYECRGLVPNEICQIVLPSGRKKNISIQNPGQEFSRYVNLALEWAEWVRTSHESQPRLSNNQEDECRLVQMELEKLKCFNYILDNTNVTGPKMMPEIGSRDIETKKQTEDVIGEEGTTINVLTERQQIAPPLSNVVTAELHAVLHKTSQVICGIDNLLLNK